MEDSTIEIPDRLTTYTGEVTPVPKSFLNPVAVIGVVYGEVNDVPSKFKC